MAVHWGGVIAVLVFYIAILVVGLWASRKTKNRDSEEVMVAGRNIGVVLGIFTMTATWLGGGFINGTAEYVYSDGLIAAQAPWAYSLSLFLGGLVFAKKMRKRGYVTMLDPFQIKYGSRMGGLLFLPALSGELLWSASILAALGATVSVILELPINLSVIISACITVAYSIVGGLYSIAYTDVVQLICMIIGLWLCVPFSLTSKAASPITENTQWLGEWNSRHTSQWIDAAIQLTLGGIPWQAYFQRVLSSRNPGIAQFLSITAAFGCIVMSIPAVLIGAVGVNTDWNVTGIPNVNQPDQDPSLILPLVIQYMTPNIVAFIGLGAVSAAVMSSADSSILSASSMFVRNIYQPVLRQGASELELIWCMRITMIVVGTMATILSLTFQSVYDLFSLCSDFVFVVLFPQLLCVVYFAKSNTYGSLLGYIVGLFFRLAGGDKTLGLPILIKYPFYEDGEQFFPFRTFSMLASLLTIMVVSYSLDYLFRSEILKPSLDVFRCIVNIPPEAENYHKSKGDVKEFAKENIAADTEI